MVSETDREQLALFGKHLKSLRLSKKLSFRKMALLCNVDYADIQRYESGMVNITLLTVLQLAKALEVEPDELLRFKKN
ncbi:MULTISPECIES: helix-turn-helix domain-containing protein [Mucilaginibacter]|uniref:Helix-turn-helix transcriptional regulator n=1 Tax=Mucilaginibacter mali TaxID=2740462 RepID=A0A7D4QSW1_9SPHI|nr:MULTISPECIES: helix-turn-helix transcriptional regulator [Mucilaginibacter]MDO3645307.1 helix-turn-helix transcriptional regulator [Mucilaginibacter sp. L3T2-6]MDV6217792.1 helix-turn-helix transcriptional regulator [Mucilaginibacter sp. L3T2-6]QKJ30269.1 helix-turn-helix transcriptional regulator [Mucilaginibacter mali]